MRKNLPIILLSTLVVIGLLVGVIIFRPTATARRRRKD